ncbi:MAG: Inositol-pentakisphosphate 2-kinase [Chaenotheca gracillima]|nr:MAG: Inositol-pentakisphosphate 2-kinase [Chaenotheca gracillima]
MGFEKQEFERLAIPTYEEAIASRPSSSRSHSRAEISDQDAEREGLLGSGQGGGRDAGRRTSQGYQPPTVESARTSIDSDLFLPSSGHGSARSSDEGLRQEMTQMEVLDAPSQQPGAPSRIRNEFSKRITSLTNSLSSIHLPFKFRFNFRFSSLGLDTTRLPVLSPGLYIFGRLLALCIVVFGAGWIFMVVIAPPRGMQTGRQFDPESVRDYAQGNMNEDSIRGYLEHLTKFDHVAGTDGDYAMASYVEGLYKAAKLDDVEMNEYEVYLNYPRKSGRRVAIVDPPNMAWEAPIEEDPRGEHGLRKDGQTLVFHGHSRAGNVTGPLVYANFGAREDFLRLKEMGIDLKGSIVLVRYYGTQGDRALKVKAAELAGAAGCIIYSDPQQDGFLKGKVWPEGIWMPSNGVQRGAVSLMSWVVGDVLTPGWASTKGAKSVSKDNNPGLVNIPSIPLPWRDAQRLLQALKGHGKKVPKDWVGGVPEVEWWSGDSKSPTVHLMNEQDEDEKRPILNVMGKIFGLEQREKMIIVGNHRDAWCLGAADPGSGSAIQLEVVRIFGEMMELGWRPLRTIQFASWDGEEYNLIGSTEWAEENIDDLRRHAFAYLNVDTGVSGTDFRAAASPLFQKALMRVLNRTVDPVSNETLRSIWDKSNTKMAGLGAGSDYVAFQDIAGTASIDIQFQGPGFPYHSCYDNFEWMSKFGDPTFSYHKTLAQVWALLILEMADQPLVPFDFEEYATAVQGYVTDLEKVAQDAVANSKELTKGLDLKPLKKAADRFSSNAAIFQKYSSDWEERISIESGLEDTITAIKRMSHNTRMANFDTHLLDLKNGGGVPGREQFKHVIFAPQAWSGYDEAYFPAVRDALDNATHPFYKTFNVGNQDAKAAMQEAQKQLEKAADILDKAAKKLLH